VIKTCLRLPTCEDFEAFLHTEGPWLAALDFPFGQPRKLITNLGWPETWEGYMHLISSMSKQAFEQTLQNYQENRPHGDKQHLRATVALAEAIRPMMLHLVTVTKNFFQR